MAKSYAAHYAFDLAGNRVSKTQTGANAGTTVSARNELATTQTNGGVTTMYRYDEDGVCLAKRVGTAAERTFV